MQVLCNDSVIIDGFKLLSLLYKNDFQDQYQKLFSLDHHKEKLRPIEKIHHMMDSPFVLESELFQFMIQINKKTPVYLALHKRKHAKLKYFFENSHWKSLFEKVVLFDEGRPCAVQMLELGSFHPYYMNLQSGTNVKTDFQRLLDKTLANNRFLIKVESVQKISSKIQSIDQTKPSVYQLKLSNPNSEIAWEFVYMVRPESKVLLCAEKYVPANQVYLFLALIEELEQINTYKGPCIHQQLLPVFQFKGPLKETKDYPEFFDLTYMANPDQSDFLSLLKSLGPYSFQEDLRKADSKLIEFNFFHHPEQFSALGSLKKLIKNSGGKIQEIIRGHNITKNIYVDSLLCHLPNSNSKFMVHIHYLDCSETVSYLSLCQFLHGNQNIKDQLARIKEEYNQFQLNDQSAQSFDIKELIFFNQGLSGTETISI
jgi:hypothetical protein